MHSFEIKKHFAVRIPLDADLFDSIFKFCNDNKILNGRFSGIGSLKSTVISHFRHQENSVIVTKISKPVELIMVCGNISEKNGVPVITGKILISDQDGKVQGGDLVSGSKVFNAELFIEEFSGINIHREYDSATGLSVWPQNLTI